MDPISTAATITSLVGTCLGVSRSLMTLRSKYARSSITITAISTECALMSTTLSQVGNLIRREPESFNTKVSSITGMDSVHLDVALQSAIESSMLSMATLQDVLSKCSIGSSSDIFTWRLKTKFLWKESDMKDTLDTVRRLQQAIGTLLTAIQAESVADMKHVLSKNAVALNTMVRRTRTVRQAYAESSHGESSISGGNETTFNFDDEVISSKAYRRAFRTFTNGKESRPAFNTGLKPPEDASDDESTGLKMRSRTPSPNELKITKSSETTLVQSSENIELNQKLQRSIKSGNVESVASLLNKGADVEAIYGKNRNRPLHVAARNIRPEIVKLLLDRGAGISSRTANGNTALHIAAETGSSDIITCLLKAGAEIGTKNSDFNGALHIASTKGRQAAIKTLLKGGAEIDARGKDGRTPLIAACDKGNRAAAEMLLKNKAEIEAGDDDNNRATHCAAMNGHEDILLLLIQYGADVEGIGFTGWHPLHHASFNGYPKTIQALIAKGADLHALSDNNNEPVHLAAEKGGVGALAALLDAGVSIETEGPEQRRPLHVAAQYCEDSSSVRMLIERGARVDSESGDVDDREFPVHKAAEGGYVENMKLLRQAGANLNQPAGDQNVPIGRACIEGNLEIVKWLVNEGIDIDSKGFKGMTPLHFAVWNDRPELVEFLIEGGANIENRDGENATPLLYAVQEKHLDCAQKLLDAGADIEVMQEGMRPVHFATQNKDVPMLTLLLERGANVSAKTDKGETPLQLAETMKNEDVVALLRNKAT